MTLQRYRMPILPKAADVVMCIDPIPPLVEGVEYIVTDVIFEYGGMLRVKEAATRIVPREDEHGWWPWRFRITRRSQ